MLVFTPAKGRNALLLLLKSEVPRCYGDYPGLGRKTK